LSQPLETPLTPYQELLLRRIERAFRLRIDTWINEDSKLVTPEFESAFRTRLLFHHSVTDEVLNKKSFEYTFRDAMRVSGRTSEINYSSTARGYDVLVDKDRYSLKTEAQRNIQANSMHISKLMECAWLRYVEGSRETLIKRIEEFVLPHFEQYDRILMLRIFRGPENYYKYVLVEIPKQMLLAIKDLKADDFVAINQRHGTTARVKYQGVNAFTLRFDGSDEKVTLSSLRIDLCITHVTWKIPVNISLAGNEEL
jgi:type II restriction enzyme